MEGRREIQSGSYEELLTSGTIFEQLVDAHNIAIVSSNNENQGESGKVEAEEQLHEAYQPRNFQGNNEWEILVEGVPGIQLTKEEDTSMGDVGWRPFLDYVNVSKWSFLLCLILVAQLAFSALQPIHSNAQNKLCNNDWSLCWNVNPKSMITAVCKAVVKPILSMKI